VGGPRTASDASATCRRPASRLLSCVLSPPTLRRGVSKRRRFPRGGRSKDAGSKVVELARKAGRICELNRGFFSKSFLHSPFHPLSPSGPEDTQGTTPRYCASAPRPSRIHTVPGCRGSPLAFPPCRPFLLIRNLGRSNRSRGASPGRQRNFTPVVLLLRLFAVPLLSAVARLLRLMTGHRESRG